MILLYGFVLLSLIVLIHELGHFIVGRCFGVKFLSFSIGMGPRVLKLKVLDTPFFISLLPLGGYVRPLALLEESIEEKNSFLNKCYRFLAPFCEEERKALDRYDSGSFENVYRKSYFAQASIILGGVLFNILSVLIACFVYFYFFKERTIFQNSPMIATVKTKSMAEYAGFRPGDRVLTINGKIFGGWEVATREMQGTSKKHVIFNVLRESAAGSEMRSLRVFQNKDYYDEDSPVRVFDEIGFSPASVKRQFSFGEALWGSFESLKLQTKMIIRSYAGLSRDKKPEPLLHDARVVASPVVAMFEIGLIASQSNEHFLFYFCAISIIVALFNLLPLPILDGGQFIMLTLDKVFKVPMSAKTIHFIQQAGFSVVLIITVLLFGKDLFQGWM